jgi:hypothetical protein
MPARVAYLQAGVADLRTHLEATLRITENIEATLTTYAATKHPATIKEMSKMVGTLREMHHMAIELVLVMDLGTEALAAGAAGYSAAPSA